VKDQELFPNLPATKEETAPAVTREDALLSTVLASGNIEVLERYIALRKSEEERQAAILFDQDFSKLQAELPAVAKSKDNKGTRSKYAPLEDCQAKWDPFIQRNGFAYSWRYEPQDNGDLRVFIDIRKHGHVRTAYVDMPVMQGVTSREGNAVQNPLQVQGVRMSYGRRYSYAAGFGGRIEGEDSDGQITDDVEQLRLDLTALTEERDGSGKLKLSQNAFDVISAELKKPAEEMDVKRMQAFYKRARAMVEGKK
jgi:hypothetical protein